MKKSFVCLSAVSVAIVCLTGRAQLRWAPLYEPGCGGAIVSVAVSPHDPQHVASGGDMLGTAASFDGGESWKPGLGLPSYEMATPTFHPTRADELWIGSCRGPFVSRDGGLTWQGRRNGMPAPCPWKYTAMIEKVLVDPARRGLWRYDPATGGWTRLHDDALACAPAADPTDPTRLVFTTMDNPYHDFAGGHGVWVSSDDGRTWTAANDGLHVRRLTCVAFDPFDPERLVAGTSGGGFVTARWPKK